MATGKYLHQIQPQHSRIHDDPELPVLALSRYAYVMIVIGAACAGKSTVTERLGQGARRFGGSATTLPIRGAHVVTPPALLTADGALHDTRAYPHIVIDDPEPTQLPFLMRLWVPRPRIVLLEASLQIRRSRGCASDESFDDREDKSQQRLSATLAIAKDSGYEITTISNDDTLSVCVVAFQQRFAGFFGGVE